jgi:hypothetical protein
VTRRPYRDDPDWQAAQQRYMADMAPDESAEAALIRRVLATNEMYEIERRYEVLTT